MEFDVVPVDLTGWYQGGAQDRDDVARKIDAACAGSGFLAITGHQVASTVISDMFETTRPQTVAMPPWAAKR